jgi:hypothetical protein
MRNHVIQALQPGSTLALQLKPPIADHERHYVLTGLGPGAVVVQLIDNARVTISNPTRFVAPFVFFIGPKTFLPPVLSRIARLLGNY